MIEPPTSTTTGWRPSCDCRDLVACPGNHMIGDCLMCDNSGFTPLIPDPVPCTVLDPFVGSGTTLLVARRLGRNAIGLDLSYPYLHDQARKRLGLDKLKKWIEGNMRAGNIDEALKR